MSLLNTKGTVLCVFAHPDDEVFRCGGTLTLLAQAGARVQVLSFTAGQAGSCGAPPLCTPENLASVRTQELNCSCKTLGIETPIVLGYPDGGLKDIPEEEGIEVLQDWVQRIQPQSIITWPLDGFSGHADHCAVGRWATRVFIKSKEGSDTSLKSLYYLTVPCSVSEALGMKELHAVPDYAVSEAINIAEVWERKIAAIHCHKTQISETPILQRTIEEQRLFLGIEHFVIAESGSSADLLGVLNEKHF